MKFNVEFSCDNAAFDEPDSFFFGEEIASILRDVAEKMQNNYTTGPCYDSNGNVVGRFWLSSGD